METKSKLRTLARKGDPVKLKKFITETNSRVILQRINEAVDDSGATPLIECVKAAGSSACRPGDGFGLCCRTFTKCGANINFRDKTERTCLHWAVHNKNPSLTTLLVGLGADCKFRDKDGLNPFHLAVKTGTKDCVTSILRLQPEFVNVEDASGIPPIIMSLQKGDYELCRLLIKEGADINVQEKRSQRTALYYALFLKHISLFEDLLELADLSISDHRLTTIIHRSCAVPNPAFLASIYKIHHDVPVSLLNKQDAEGATAIITACQNGLYEHLQMLVDRKASVSIRDRCKRTALHHCADNFDTKCAKLLLKVDTSLLNVEDHEGLTALHLAVITGNIPLINVLLKRGADLTCQDFEKHTVAHWATVRGLSEVLSLLIDYGADILTPDAHNAYPLHYAAQIVHEDSGLETYEDGTDVLRMLLNHDSPVNAVDDDGRTPLLWAASSGNTEACRVFVDAGADIGIIDNHGLTALHCAASRGHVSTVRCLVKDCKMKVDVVDKNLCTALFYAITLGNLECMKLLIELGANLSHLDTKGRTPAHCAAVKGSVEAIDILYKRNVDLWKHSQKGDLPIHEAAQTGHSDVVDYLLKNKPADKSVDVVNHVGRSCLHIAALTNNVWLCKCLIDNGANINLIMKQKGKYYTPYDVAVIKGNQESAEYIKSKGGHSGQDITHEAALIIQRNIRSKYGRPKSSKQRRVKSPVASRKRSVSPTPYAKERRSSFRHNENHSDRVSSERSPSRLTVSHTEDTKGDRLSSAGSSKETFSASKHKDKKVSRTATPSPEPVRKSGTITPSPRREESKKVPKSNQSSTGEESKTRKISGENQQSSDSGPKAKQTHHKNKLIEEVQASVRRFEAERKYIREMHQMRRAQLYMGPMYDIGLYRHMANDTDRPKTSNTAKAEKDSLHSLSHWDQFVEDQCKFVSHIHQDNKPSYRRVRSAAERQHRQLKTEAVTSKKNTEKKCQKLEREAQEKEKKLEAVRKKQEKELAEAKKRAEELYNEANSKADNSIQEAKKVNQSEEERIEQEEQNREQKMKCPKSPGTQPNSEKLHVSGFEAEERERRESYRQWQKRKADELRKRLYLAYRPYLPSDLFPEDKKVLDVNIKSATRRPVTSFSYNSTRSRPASTFSKRENRETRTVMTAYGSRKIVVENGNKESKIPNGTAHTRTPLVFMPPDVYESKERERKQRERNFQQQKQNQPVEICA